MMRKRWSPPARRGEGPEQRANRWAADLLMPEHLFVPAVENGPITLNAVRDLTRWFSTSFFATALRMVRFSPASAILVWSRPNQRYKWFGRSPQMPAALWPRPQPGPETVAYGLLRGSRSNTGPIMVRWGEWVNLDDPPLSYIVEDSMRMQNGEVFSLLVWTDESTGASPKPRSLRAAAITEEPSPDRQQLLADSPVIDLAARARQARVSEAIIDEMAGVH